ncbi:MAG: DUF1788 domain-containing protein [Treponemataceae bacterium]|nr:MAG: DUF1788 domain-containing protein [Treponemataceae bacterium]
MNKITSLKRAYERLIQTPWQKNISPEQRVIFCVYNENDERALRIQIDEFKYAAESAAHPWLMFDLTDTFAQWLCREKYVEEIFMDTDELKVQPFYLAYLKENFSRFVADNNAGEEHVIAVSGVASLFSLLKVKQVVLEFAPLVKGRLVVFFPGSYSGNNYRLLDSYDGWGYLAIPIVGDTE